DEEDRGRHDELGLRRQQRLELGGGGELVPVRGGTGVRREIGGVLVVGRHRQSRTLCLFVKALARADDCLFVDEPAGYLEASTASNGAAFLPLRFVATSWRLWHHLVPDSSRDAANAYRALDFLRDGCRRRECPGWAGRCDRRGRR